MPRVKAQCGWCKHLNVNPAPLRACPENPAGSSEMLRARLQTSTFAQCITLRSEKGTLDPRMHIRSEQCNCAILPLLHQQTPEDGPPLQTLLLLLPMQRQGLDPHRILHMERGNTCMPLVYPHSRIVPPPFLYPCPIPLKAGLGSC